MTESTNAEGTPPEGGTEPTDEGAPKSFDEAYVKKLRDEAAKHRTEAKANAKAAEELAAIKKTQQTAEERAAEELAAARTEAAEARAEALRFKVASKHGITDEDADLFLTGTDEDTLTRQAERLAGIETERKKNGNRAPNEGANPTPGTDSKREFLRSLTGSG